LVVPKEKELRSFYKEDGRSPYLEWYEEQEIKGQNKITARLNSVALGNMGKVKAVGNGVHELKFKPKGLPAYRIYFANDGQKIILLLNGGAKSNQQKDIDSAKEYWNEYNK